MHYGDAGYLCILPGVISENMVRRKKNIPDFLFTQVISLLIFL